MFWQRKHTQLNDWQCMRVEVSFWSANHAKKKFIIIHIAIILIIITLTLLAPSSSYNFGCITAYLRRSNFVDTRKLGEILVFCAVLSRSGLMKFQNSGVQICCRWRQSVLKMNTTLLILTQLVHSLKSL